MFSLITARSISDDFSSSDNKRNEEYSQPHASSKEKQNKEREDRDEGTVYFI